MNFETLLLEETSDRLVIKLHRPEVRNAIDQQMVDELHEVCAELEREPKILIICGDEKVFASGADIAQLRERRRDDALKGINSQIFHRIALLPMPVIAAMDGFALGGGAELAYAADFRIAGENLKIGNPETSLGIIAAAGAMWRLPEIVGEPVAKEILLTGRILNAEEAHACRLVTEVHPSDELMQAAHSLADKIASQDPLAVRMSKALLRAPRSAHPSIDEQAQAVLFESEEKFRRMTEFLERKTKK